MVLPHEKLRALIQNAIVDAYPDASGFEIVVAQTPDPAHGDYATTIALKLAPMVHQAPLEIAQHLVAKIGQMPMLEKAVVAAPGYINFYLRPAWILSQADKILADRTFGAPAKLASERIVLEFVSANPTGPVTLGNGRAAFSGDALANVLTLSGHRVTREFYINDRGNQANVLAESVLRRYWQQHGVPTEYPDYCYQGEYVADLAKTLHIDRLKIQDMVAVRDRIKTRILEMMIRDQMRLMKSIGVKYDVWFRESRLYAKRTDQKVFEVLRSHDLLFEKDGATWFRTTAFGDDKDRVLIKSDGTQTYLVADIALRWNRFAERHFDREIIFLGADHHGYIGRLQAAAAALGFARRITVNIIQFVRLMRDGQEVKMSKRAGTYVTLDELIDEVGTDVARFFFLMHSANSHMDFDLNAAKEKSEKNPVFYVQYAHARIASVLRKVGRRQPVLLREAPHASELALVKSLLEFPGLVAEVAVSSAVHKLPVYAMDLAAKFHDYYTNCRIIEGEKVWKHRLVLLKATQVVLRKTLGLMGVSAPEKM